jgi:hypothetical protein
MIPVVRSKTSPQSDDAEVISSSDDLPWAYTFLPWLDGPRYGWTHLLVGWGVSSHGATLTLEQEKRFIRSTFNTHT